MGSRCEPSDASFGRVEFGAQRADEPEEEDHRERDQDAAAPDRAVLLLVVAAEVSRGRIATGRVADHVVNDEPRDEEQYCDDAGQWGEGLQRRASTAGTVVSISSLLGEPQKERDDRISRSEAGLNGRQNGRVSDPSPFTGISRSFPTG